MNCSKKKQIILNCVGEYGIYSELIIYLSAPKPPNVILINNAVDHLYPWVQLHLSRFWNVRLPKHSRSGWTEQFVLKYSIITKENQQTIIYTSSLFENVIDLNGLTPTKLYFIHTHKIDSPNYNYLLACTNVPNFRFANNIDRSYFVEIRVVPAISEILEFLKNGNNWTTYNAWNILICIARY